MGRQQACVCIEQSTWHSHPESPKHRQESNRKKTDKLTDTPDEPQVPASGSDIALVSINEEMRKSYLDYAMSVIVSRALPDVCDGLKPVHRRILLFDVRTEHRVEPAICEIGTCGR